jgi:hypothetical protein
MIGLIEKLFNKKCDHGGMNLKSIKMYKCHIHCSNCNEMLTTPISEKEMEERFENDTF